MKNILITGYKGFIGHYLEKKLVNAGFIVYGIDLPEKDITTKEAFTNIEEIRFERAFHLAGMTFIPDSWKDPEKFFHINVTGTLRILEFCRRTETPLTSISSYLYGRPQYLPINENHPIQPLNSYHQSKFLAEQLCQFYQRQFDVSVVIIRPFNIYGPRQRKDFLIPSIIRQLIDDEAEKITINDFSPRRDYLFIDDFTNALMLTLRLKDGIFNIGSGFSISVGEIIEMLFKIRGKKKMITVTNKKRMDEIDNLYADISAFQGLTNWIPEVSLNDGLRICLDEELKKQFLRS